MPRWIAALVVAFILSLSLSGIAGAEQSAEEPQPSFSSRDIWLWSMEEIQALREVVREHIASKTGETVEEVKERIENDLEMRKQELVEQAKNFSDKIIDKIQEKLDAWDKKVDRRYRECW